MDWTFSRHALSRAVDMALDAEEIRAALENPTRPLPSLKYPGAHLIHSDRLVFAVYLEPRYVITIIWNTFDGKRSYKHGRDNDIDLCRDPQPDKRKADHG